MENTLERIQTCAIFHWLIYFRVWSYSKSAKRKIFPDWNIYFKTNLSNASFCFSVNHLSRGIIHCRLGFLKLESATAAYCVCDVTTKINIWSIYFTMHNRHTITSVPQWLVIVIVVQAIAMTNLSMFTERCMTFHFSRWISLCKALVFYLLRDKIGRTFFKILVTAIGGRPKPELCFLPGRLRWTVLPKERYGNSLSGCGSNTQASNWEADT